MKKQLLIAIVKEKHHPNAKNYSRKDFIQTAEVNGNLYTTNEFEEAWNTDEIKVSEWFIRFVRVDIKVLL